MKLLMHTCCAPCSVYCIDSLREEGIEPTLYWYNPNIHTYAEYKLRRDTLIEYSKLVNAELILEDYYGLDEFCENVSKDIENRCLQFCYIKRLEQTVKFAKENGFDTFTTTLFVSPYQKHDEIKKICEHLAQKYDIDFLYRDFKIGYSKGQLKARELGLYMQKYCGCIFSEEDSLYKQKKAILNMPEGVELEKEPRLLVKRVNDPEEYLELFLDADPSEELVKEYLKEATVYGLTKGDEIVSLAVLIHVDRKTIELKNLVTVEKYRGKGYARTLLKSLVGNYKQKYEKMIVGTSENNIPFYVKQGFDKYEKTIKNFFIDNYKNEIRDGNLLCTDMFYYSKKLK